MKKSRRDAPLNRSSSLESDEDRGKRSEITRREFLRGAVAFALGAPPLFRLFGDRIHIFGDDEKLVVSLDGILSWILHSRMFGNTARLQHGKSKDKTYRFLLSNAIQPGISSRFEIGGEFTEEAIPVLRLQSPLGKGEATLAPWLRGNFGLPLRSAGFEIASQHIKLRIPPGTVRLNREWQFVRTGLGSASAAVEGLPLLSAGRIQIGFCPLKKEEKNALTVSLSRIAGLPEYRFPQELDGWYFDRELARASHLLVELKTSGEESVSAAFSGDIVFYPSNGTVSDNGDPLALPLRNLKRIVSWSQDGTDDRWTAEIQGNHRFHTNVLSATLVGNSRPDGIEIISGDEQHAAINAPIHQVSLPAVAGLVIQNVRVPLRARFPYGICRLVHRIGAAFADAGYAVGHFLHLCHCSDRLRLDGLRLSVLRPEDFLWLEFGFSNVTLEVGGLKVRLVKPRSEDPRISLDEHSVTSPPIYEWGDPQTFPSDDHNSYITIYHAPQNVWEEALNESASVDQITHAKLSGGSRLSFQIPDKLLEDEGLEFTLETLLSWHNFLPQIASEAAIVPAGRRGFDLSDVRQTAVEYPRGLILSPNEEALWRHSAKSPDDNDPNEMWHTQLFRPHRDGINVPPTLVAVAALKDDESPQNCTATGPAGTSTCNLFSPAPGPSGNALNEDDRCQIKLLTCGAPGLVVCGQPYSPKPIPAQNLILSGLGAWFATDTDWEIPANLSLEAWRHRATMARDHLCKVAYKGYLLPFGFRATLIKETWRRPDKTSDNFFRAPLRQRFYLVIKKPIKSFWSRNSESDPVQPPTWMVDGGRRFQFQSVETLTSVTGSVLIPSDTDKDSNDRLIRIRHQPGAFYPTDPITRDVLLFHFRATDLAQPAHAIDFKMPVAFVQNELAASCVSHTCSNELQQVLDGYNRESAGRNVGTIDGTEIQYAPSTKPGDTQFRTFSLTFNAEAAGPLTNCFDQQNQPCFVPFVSEASTIVPAVHELAGSETVSISYHQRYQQKGFSTAQDGNRGEVFAVLNNSQSPLKFPLDKAGGLIVPSVKFSGLSRLAGVVGGAADSLDTFSSGAFDAAKFFSGFSFDQYEPKLFGVIRLGDVIRPLGDLRNKLNAIPKLIFSEIHQLTDQLAAIASSLKNLANSLNVLNTISNFFTAHPLDASAAQAVKDQAKVVGDNIKALYGFKSRFESFGLVRTTQPAAAAADRLVDIKKRLHDALVNIQQLSAAEIAGFEELVASCVDTRVDEFVTWWSAVNDRLNEALIPEITQIWKDVNDQIQLIPNLTVPELIELISRGPDSAPAKAILSLPGKIPQLLKSWLDFVNAVQSAANANQLSAVVLQGSEALKTGAAARIKNLRTGLQQEVDSMRDALLARAGSYAQSTLKPSIDAAISQTRGELTSFQQKLNSLEDAFVRALTDAIVDAVSAALTELVGFLSDHSSELWQAVNTVTSLYATAQAAVGTVMAAVNTPYEFKVEYSFSPELMEGPSGFPIFQPSSQASMQVATTYRKTLVPLNVLKGDLGQDYLSVDASIKDFNIVLLPNLLFLTLTFKQVSFKSENGSKPAVSAELQSIAFGDALQWIQDFARLVGGLSNRIPGVTVDASGVHISYAAALPALSAGAFSISGLGISVRVEIPFDNHPMLIFLGFASEQQKCHIRIGIYGGTLFLDSGMAPASSTSQSGVVTPALRSFHSAIETGFTGDISVGPAHGEVHLFCGVYYGNDFGRCRLSGYVDAGGNCDIAGLIRMSVNWHLALNYASEGNRMWGECTVSVDIEIGFFSISFSLSMRKDISGSSAAPMGLNPATANVVPPVTLDDRRPYPLQNITSEMWDRYRSALVI